MSNQNGREIIGASLSGGKFERTNTHGLQVVALPENDPSVTRVVGTEIKGDAHLIETNHNTMNFVGVAPPPGVVKAFRNSTPHQSRQEASSTKNVSFKVRLIDFSEKLDFTYPRNTTIKKVLEEIRKRKSVDMVLRMSLNGSDLDPNTTLEQEGVEMNQTLYAFEVEAQNTLSSVGSANVGSA